jgi:hypothetical protein
MYVVNIGGNKYYKVQRFGREIFEKFMLRCVTFNIIPYFKK